VAEPVSAGARQGSNLPELSVSELSSAIKKTLEGAYGYVRLRGEISGFRGAHSSGHCYFALKDERAKIEAVIWRGTVPSLRIKPAEGLEVVATGRVTTYPNSSKYQIVIDTLEPAGIGALMALLEERKRKLAAEGLFEEARKKALPFLPRVIGIVTSPTGAVIRDMLAGFTERFPAHVLLWPVRVQGETCAAEVSAAIRGFNALRPDGAIPRPDILIVARGGGALADLWGFNEEIVARAVSGSAIPIISAVGHETDWTLIDLVADARAPTPTKAAEWAVPKHSELTERMGECGTRLIGSARRLLEGMRRHLLAASRGLPRRQDIVALPRQRFDSIERRLSRGLLENARAHGLRLARAGSRLTPQLIEARVERARSHLDRVSRRKSASLSRTTAPHRSRFERVSGRLRPDALAQRLARCGEQAGSLAARARTATRASIGLRRRQVEGYTKLLTSLSYQGVLQRGYALLRDEQGRSVRSAAAVGSGQRLDVQLSDGHIQVRSEGASTGRPAASTDKVPQAPIASRAKSGSGGGNQGSLF
jgi:exodeoxyribonuclease VII large subunit